MPEGYWQNGLYYYYLKDHQGNTRAVINPSGTVMEYSDYYPDGMRFWTSTSNSGALPYRYNGKELEAMNGLNEYDYGARRRETGIPVWTTVDPLAEKYYGVSPYAFCAGNPIYYVDPDGMKVIYNQNENGYDISGDDVYAYLGYLQDIQNGTGSMDNMLAACNAAAQGNGNGENGTNLPTTENEVTAIGEAPKTSNQNTETSNQNKSWLYPIIGKLDGNKELDSRINPYIPSSKEINSEVDMEMQIGLLFMPTDVIGIAASTLVKMGYSATQQFLLKSILYAMEHPKAIYNGFRLGIFAAGMATSRLSNLPTSPDPSPSISPYFDFGFLLEQDLKMLIKLPQQHDQK
jgi:RHS repeat-associated protein